MSAVLTFIVTKPCVAWRASYINRGLPKPRSQAETPSSRTPPFRRARISARERGRPIPRSLPENCTPSGPLGREGAFSCAYAAPGGEPRNPMPKRTDISTILIIGAGPIIIGQACEFDYSGTQACKTLRAEGYRIVLINSNPATIMTDPDMADRTYIEPITPEIVEKIIAKERHAIPGGFALLPTMGGQTALNCALSLRKMGVLENYDVEMIGATADAIDKAEDRELFREAMTKIGLETPRSHQVKTLSPGADRARRHRPARDHPPELHHGRHRRGHRLHAKRIDRDRRARHRRFADRRGADRGERARLERIRDGGGARQGRTIASSSARSRTSIRWASTPAIRSPSRRR